MSEASKGEHDSDAGSDGAHSRQGSEGAKVDEGAAGAKAPLMDNSDSSAKPKKRRVNKKAQVTKRSKRIARQQSEDEPEEPASTRPRRTRSSGVNYTLLLQDSDYQSEDPEIPTPTDAPDPPRKSKMVTLRTGRRTLSAPLPLLKSPRRTRQSGSIDGDVDDDKAATSRNHTVKEVIRKTDVEQHAGPNGQPGFLKEELRSPRKRRRRIDAHLDMGVEPQDQIIPDKDETLKSVRKRKRVSIDETENQPANQPINLAALSRVDRPSQKGKGKKKMKRKKEKPFLGYLPNGQLRQRRRRVGES